MLRGTNQKTILCFGAAESTLEQQLNDRELRKKTNPYDPLVYMEELVDYLIQQPFENFSLQPKELIDQIKAGSKYPLWEDIQAIIWRTQGFNCTGSTRSRFLKSINNTRKQDNLPIIQ